MKECTKCKKEKPFTEYYKRGDGRGLDGFKSHCKECLSKAKKLFRDNNREHVSKQKSNSYYRNREQTIKTVMEYERNRCKSDPDFKLMKGLRSRQRTALNGKLRAAPTREVLGCSYKHARQHIESQFTEGMTWDNWAFDGWHMDHIMPCASFDLTDPEQQRECFHYTNLQPLWAKDNLSKGDKLPHELTA